jgi:hypothetical protein
VINWEVIGYDLAKIVGSGFALAMFLSIPIAVVLWAAILFGFIDIKMELSKFVMIAVGCVLALGVIIKVATQPNAPISPADWSEMVQDCILTYPSNNQYPSLAAQACVAKYATARGYVLNSNMLWQQKN